MRTLDSIDAVVALFDAFGSDPYDEQLSQLDHGLQCAALAVGTGADDALVVAALLHDIGHLLDLESGGTATTPVIGDHAAAGSDALSTLFPQAVTAPIARHVEAKRYLVRVEPGLLDRLSDGSRRSLVHQGGPMDDDETARFERDPWFAAACALRRWDDAGKVDGLVVPSFDEHLARLRRLAQS